MVGPGSAFRWLKQRCSWNEASGSLGDIGTFLPLLVGLTKGVGLDLGTSLVFTGLYNIGTGLLFDIPMPVQPMKAIAAVAIADDQFNLPEVLAAGIFVGGVTLVLGLTRAVDSFHRLVPGSVVRGIQLSVGLSLAQKGVMLVAFRDTRHQHFREAAGTDSIWPGLIAAGFILVTTYLPAARGSLGARPHPLAGFSLPSNAARSSDEGSTGRGRGRSQGPAAAGAAAAAPGEHGGDRGDHGEQLAMRQGMGSNGSLSQWLLGERDAEHLGLVHEEQQQSKPEQSTGPKLPAALIIVLAGLVMTLVWQNPSAVRSMHLGPAWPKLTVPTKDQWLKGIVGGGLPQLPLTALNSVVAVCQLSGDLFPGREARPALVAASVGLMNLVGPWLGALPCCHGAGGLAAQVRFGGRTGAAPLILGVGKLATGLLFGSTLLTLLQSFPQSLLGALLVFSGAELASAARHQTGERGVLLMLLTAASISALKNTGLGFVVGLAAAVLLHGADWALAARPSWLRHNQAS